MTRTRTLAEYNADHSDVVPEEEDSRPDGFVDLGGGAVLPVKNGQVQFPRAGKTARPATTRQRNMFGGAIGTVPSEADQYRMANANLGMAMDAIQRENDSRVAQRREMRRIGADYETERLRQMGANYRANVDAEAQLIRQLLADM